MCRPASPIWNCTLKTAECAFDQTCQCRCKPLVRWPVLPAAIASKGGVVLADTICDEASDGRFSAMTTPQTGPDAGSIGDHAPSGSEFVAPFSIGGTPTARGFLAKLFFQSAPADARLAITNRLATSPVRSIGAADVSADLAAFGVHGKGARDVLVGIWRQAVVKFLLDDLVTDEESSYLAELRRALGLTEAELRVVDEDLVQGRFATAVGRAIAGDHLRSQDRAQLDELAKAIRLPTDVAQRILESVRMQRINRAAQAAIADRRLSPDDIKYLHTLATNLDIDLKINAETQKGLDRFALLWRIENGDIPAVAVTISLQKSETCYAVADAVWHELRTKTDRYNYAGPVASIRIFKGFRYRVGSVSVRRITHDEMTEIDRGRIYLTSKRVIFEGSKKNATISLSSLLTFTPYSDGVALERASGKTVHLVLSNVDLEVFQTILGAVLSARD